jgi:uncharacterized protein (TIGR02646 family)
LRGASKRPSSAPLDAWWALNGADPAPAWKELQNPDKTLLLLDLLEDQDYCCVYCGRGITPDPFSSHIEHFWPQRKFEKRRFDWQNLFASCGPSRAKGSRTCGAQKDDWVPANFVEPEAPGCRAGFSFDGLGQIHGTTVNAANMVTVLNLDDDALVYERLEIIDYLEQLVRDGEIDESSKAAEIQLWLARDGDGKCKSFGHVAARYLEEQDMG